MRHVYHPDALTEYADAALYYEERVLEQLRGSRTKATSPTGVPTLPENVAGVPIVITDSLGNAEV